MIRFYAQKKHRTALHTVRRETVVRIQPMRVVKRRAKELLCVVDESLEWIDEENVDISPDRLPALPEISDDMCPIISIEKVYESPGIE
ncbi:hypothetical protein G9C98_007680 [Cotesia typhae]|uniref:Uncharacterized protein n=1 Tax=Cotesia typhae TaxID=2053667 RepID=A0A8J5R184_9HYME|nr:hypothetical protein G9C98_007680 [Cotesia typhae]